MTNEEFNRLKTGIQVIDEQHGNLITIIDLYALHRDDALFETLEEEFNHHSITEEILMANANYPKFIEHMGMHSDRFKHALSLIKDGQIEAAKTEIIAHIITWDIPMAEWLKKQAKGV